MGETGQRTDPDRSVLFHDHAAQFIQPVYTYQFRACALSFSHLDEHVASACNNLCLRILQKQSDRIVHTLRLMQCLHIIHSLSPLFRIRADLPL